MYRQILLSLCLAALAGGTLSCAEQKPVGTSVEAASAPVNLSPADAMIRDAELEIERSPDSPVVFTRLAGLYIKKARETGDFGLNSKAESSIKQALVIAPNDATARKLSASLHLTFHRFADALSAGRELQKDFPDDTFVYGVLADANVELGNYPEAVEAAQKMVSLKPNTASYARASHLRSLYGDDKGAIEAMKLAARTADPADKEAQSWCLVQLGDILMRTGKFPEAELVYDEALVNFPNYYLAVTAKGKVRAARGDLVNAAKYLLESQNRVPNADAIVLLGNVYTVMGNSEKAAQQAKLLEIVEEKLGSAGDQTSLALFWADRDIRLDEALVIAEREYAARKDIYTTDVYAWCLYKNGRHAEAKTVIAEAMRLKTNDARIMYHAGMIDAALGDKKGAREQIAAALKLNPAFDLIQAAVAKKALEN